MGLEPKTLPNARNLILEAFWVLAFALLLPCRASSMTGASGPLVM